MKMTHTFSLFSFLACCCFFSGISGHHGPKDECSEFQKSEKGGQIFCTYEYKPVCGTNGVTYPNKCALCTDQAAGVHVHIKHDGECKAKPDVCSKVSQQEKGQPVVCTKEYFPVCGTNGITYPNLCFFCAAKRESGVPLNIKHKGECKEKDVCSEFPEPPKGQAPACTREWKPVCGSDGETYENLCAFCHARRQSGGTLKINHKGPCKEKDECSKYPIPPKGKPVICTLELLELCGSDGVTYPNKCVYCDAKRQSGGKLRIKHEGPCEQQDQKDQKDE